MNKEVYNILKKTRTPSLAGYLLYETVPEEKVAKDCDDFMEEAYETLYTALENRIPNLSRNDNKLAEALQEFSKFYKDAYFEAGLFAGFQVYKNLNS